jgi:hypothetical protein
LLACLELVLAIALAIAVTAAVADHPHWPTWATWIPIKSPVTVMVGLGMAAVVVGLLVRLVDEREWRERVERGQSVKDLRSQGPARLNLLGGIVGVLVATACVAWWWWHLLARSDQPTWRWPALLAEATIIALAWLLLIGPVARLAGKTTGALLFLVGLSGLAVSFTSESEVGRVFAGAAASVFSGVAFSYATTYVSASRFRRGRARFVLVGALAVLAATGYLCLAVPAVPPPAPAPHVTFTILNGHGRCLDADTTVSTNEAGTRVQLWDCDGANDRNGANQRWFWNGEKLENEQLQRCLKAFGQDNGSVLRLVDCADGDTWALSGDNINDVGTGRCMEADTRTLDSDGTNMQIWDCTDNDDEVFHII